MSITDELREWAKDNTLQDMVLTTYPPQHAVHGVLETILRIADRIDAEHKKACDDAWDNGYEADYLGIEKWLTEHPQVMGHHGWVQLPKDADGEPIQVGDVMKWCDSGDTLEVIGIGDDTLFYIDPEGDRTYAEWTSARNKRHYHAPTVEDVLREFANEVYADADNEIRDRDFLCAKYAKRLTLAEEEDA